jgi:hypothetical protein
VMASDIWMQESGVVGAATASAAPVIEFDVPATPPAPRFLSEDEEPEAMPMVTRVAVQRPAFDDSAEPEPELVGAAARPKFAELEEAPAYNLLPRNHGTDGNGVHAADAHSQPAVAPFTEPGTDAERDLDVPAFMRRLHF